MSVFLSCTMSDRPKIQLYTVPQAKEEQENDGDAIENVGRDNGRRRFH